MNERIKELAQQATILEHDELFVREVFDREKFAELIVRECVEICAKENWKTLGVPVSGLRRFDRGILSGRRIMSKELCDKIEEHFGVE